MATSLNGVVVYSSRNGTTLQYADWMKRELEIPMIDPARLDDQVLAVCDFVVIGTPVYSGKLLIGDWLTDNHERLGGTRLFLFVVGTDLADRGKRLMVIRDNVPTGMLARCEVFFLAGRLIVDGVEAVAADGDLVTVSNIIPLVRAVRAFAGRSGVGQ